MTRSFFRVEIFILEASKITHIKYDNYDERLNLVL